jgi:(4S)-4-hydroxy-5-phosphonooxypentane-2,3-dione isomerase
MLKQIPRAMAAVTLAEAVWLLPPLRSQAAAQSAASLIYVVNLDIVPARFDKFMDAAKANAVVSMKEPGCRNFLITQAQDDPQHVMFVELYDNAAALEAHHATDHFKTYAATTKDLVAKQNARQFSSVTTNMN